jgi:YD repeat-containing protein
MTDRLLGPLLFALALPPVARADEVWVWTDAAGEVHYTNESASIPEKYRSSVRSLGGEKLKAEVKPEAAPEPPKDSTPPERKEPPGEATGQPQPPPPEPIETAVRAPDPDEKVSEEQWRTMFRKANDRVQRSERQTKRTREALAKLPGQDVTTSYDAYGNLVVESRYQALKLQLDEDERTLEDARERLHDLERAAAREAVPLEWRR